LSLTGPDAVSQVIADSPAEQAGLIEGYIVIRINSDDINKLKDLSDILKSLSPGDRVSIIFLREKKKMTAEVNLTTR
jgi:serine protease Do